MAKNKIEIDIVVNGKMQKATVSAKKLNDALGKTAASAQVADRTLKGAAGASSNTTKNFSKMAQGINGGLVPAYATLAANLFAVSAAFTFLKDAGNLVTLQKGQEAYAGATGVALRSLSNDIIAATEAQINFTDASQAAAIGTSAGLSADQLTRLGTAAKDASIILGRDVTDSFNRLVRGVTKAEPELLDELGIILRLDDATQKYADSLDRDAKSLTAFERSQAVANDVLEQAEQKYSRIIAVVNPGVNVFNKLGKSFDDIVNSIKEFAAAMLGPFAEAISQFPALGVALLGIFGKGVLTAALPGLRDIGENARESAEKAQESFDKAKASLKDYTTETRVANKEAAAARAQGLGDPGFRTTKPGSGFDLIQKGRGGELSSQQLSGMKRAVANSKTMTKEMKRNWDSALNEMLLATKRSTKGIEQEFKKTTGKIGVFIKMAEVKVKGAFASMKLAAASFAGFAATALSVLSWVSLIATLGVTVYQFFKTKKAADENSQALDYASEKVSALTDEFKNFNKIQDIITEDGAGSLKYFTALGERIGSFSVGTLTPLFEVATVGFDSIKESSQDSIESLTKDLETARSELENFNKASIKLSSSFDQMSVFNANVAVDPSNRIALLEEKLAQADKTFGDFLNTSDDQRLAKLGAYFTDQAGNLEIISNNLGGRGTLAIKAYLSTVQELLNTKSPERAKELWQELERQQVAVADATMLFKNYTRGLEDTKNQARQLRNSFMGMTAAESAVVALETQVKLTEGLLEKNGELSEQQEKDLEITKRDLAFAEAIDNLEKDKLTRANELALRTEKDLRGRTKRQADLINLELKSVSLANDRAYIQDQITILENERIANSGELNNQEETRLENLQQELKLNEEKEKSLERQVSLSFQLLDTANQALESNLQSNIAAIIKGSEKSFKDAILNIGKGVLEGIADKLAGQLTDIVMGTDPLIKAQQGALTVARALTDGAAAVGTAIKQAFGEATKSVTSVKDSIGSILGDGDFVGPPEPRKEKTGGVLAGIGAVLFGRKVKTSVEDEQGTVSESGVSRAGGLFSPLINFFSKTENPFFQGLKGIFSKDNPLIQGFGKLFQGMMPLLGKLFTGGIGMLGGFLGFANGGMAKGGFQAYANGGIATKPTLGLVGEGRYNEAIVPMPNGKAIPVDMKGAGQQNNVTVNVSVDSQGNASTNMQQDSAQAGNLGQVIARAVQQELQNQKRSGGILSPYGAT